MGEIQSKIHAKLELKVKMSKLILSLNSPHRHVFKTHLLLLHLNSFGWQRPLSVQLDSSDPSAQSLNPLQRELFGMHWPFIHVASFTEQAVDGRVHVG